MRLVEWHQEGAHLFWLDWTLPAFYSICAFDLLLFSLFENRAIGLCTGSADFPFCFSSDLEMVGFQLEDVEVSVESDFCWMVTGHENLIIYLFSWSQGMNNIALVRLCILGLMNWERVLLIGQRLARWCFFLSFTKKICQLADMHL